MVRSQFFSLTAATLTDAAATSVDVVRPVSASEPAYAENSDWVVAPYQVRSNEAGKCVMVLSSALQAADIYLRSVEVWRRDSRKAQSNMAAAMFPSGATAAASYELVSSVFSSGGLDSVATNSAECAAILGGTFAAVQQAGIMLKSDEFVRLGFYNAAAGTGTVTGNIEAKYDLGLNQANLPAL